MLGFTKLVTLIPTLVTDAETVPMFIVRVELEYAQDEIGTKALLVVQVGDAVLIETPEGKVRVNFVLELKETPETAI